LSTSLVITCAISGSSSALGLSESKYLVGGALPWNRQLLLVYDLISSHNLFNHRFRFSVVHCVYLVNPVLVSLFKTLVLLLQLLVGLCELLVNLGVLVVFSLKLLLFQFEILLLRSHHVFQLALTLLQILLVVFVRLFALI